MSPPCCPQIPPFHACLQGVDDRLDVRLHGLVGELGAGQRAHALQGQVAQVGLPVLQELAQLVTGPDQQVRLAAQTPKRTTELRQSRH